MKITFEEPDNGIRISSVKIIWNNDVLPPVMLTKSIFSNEWSVELNDLAPGKYEYRFLINEQFTLNNPKANMYSPDKAQLLWSLLVIDKDGTQLFSNEHNSVHIEAIQMNDDYYDDIRDFQTEFSTDISKQAVIRYTFTRVKGAHTVNVLWISPDNKVSEWAESVLINPETIWFGLDFSSLAGISSGMWSVHLFVDGEYILKNDFNVKYVQSVSHSLNMSV